MHSVRLFVFCAAQRATVLRALGVATVITPILMAVNHWAALVNGALDAGFLLQAGLTFLVPYAVSTYSSARAEMLRHSHNDEDYLGNDGDYLG